MINLTPLTSSPATLPSYLTQAEADGLALALPSREVAAYVAAADADKVAALAAATSDIDAAMRYQGRKWGEVWPSLITGQVQIQVLEFPRYIGVVSGQWSVLGGPIPYGLSTINYPLTTSVWDWDVTTNAAIVPEKVKRACLLQAASRLSARRDARLDARHDGVKDQSGGGLKEMYDDGPVKVLCRVADQIMERYRLRSGEMV